MASSTTISVDPNVKSRLEQLRPFESISWSEFLDSMADEYESSKAGDSDGGDDA